MIELNARTEALLKALVERYIADGHPVGSRTLAKECGLDLSPATIRNVMADLEELGLVRSPHTSAGRVPTERGYRVFVDRLLTAQPFNAEQIGRFEDEFAHGGDRQQLIATASQLLSEVTRLVGLITLPRQDDLAKFRQLDFVALSGQRVLVILVTEDGRVQNRVIYAERRYSPAELVQAANYFNQTYSGLSVGEIKRLLLQDMQRATEELQRMMQAAVEFARRVLLEETPAQEELVVRGESRLMDFPELGNVQMLRKLFEAFNTKRDLLHLLDQSLRAGGVKIFIGAESGYESLEACSVVAAPYAVGGRVVGTLGVVGPTRMAYEHVIPLVDVTARLLSSALSDIER